MQFEVGFFRQEGSCLSIIPMLSEALRVSVISGNCIGYLKCTNSVEFISTQQRFLHIDCRAIHLYRTTKTKDTSIVAKPRSGKCQLLANRSLDDPIFIERLWPRESAWVDMDFRRPMLERNHLRKLITHSTHNSADTRSRSVMGSIRQHIPPMRPSHRQASS